MAEERTPTPLPSRIGEYRILKVLGEGGMGMVYEAEQLHPRRRVALKVIRTGRSISSDHVRLFQREAQALALLTHPSVAQIYESGRTEDGQHFFAMELVRGQPLDDYMSLHPITAETGRGEVRRMLLLFREICDAVNYAHQRGVVHRDLKPSNVLVVRDTSFHTQGASGGPYIKILDFGIARITDTDTLYATATDRVVGTLAYMSPEQASGNPDEIDLRSDIYSLGVLLYEVLTGRLPYELAGFSFAALHKIISQPPLQPSEVWRELGRRMDPDLETIVLKALAKEPDRRYQSAWALAEDIERYLASQPILARPPDAWYQLRKLASRYRMPFYSAAVVLVSLVGGLVQTGRGRAQAVSARGEAEAEAARAEAVTDFMFRMLGSADPRQDGRDVRVLDVLDQAVAEAGQSFQQDPRLHAAILTTIGRTYLELGAYDESRPLLEQAVAIRRDAGDPDLDESLTALGTLELELGAFDDATAYFEEALGNRSRRFGARSPQAAGSLNDLASVRLRAGEYDTARELLSDALAIRREQGDEYEISVVLDNLGVVDSESGAYAEADRRFTEAAELRRRAVGAKHLDVASVLNNRAIVLTAMERFDEAEDLYLESLAIYRDALGDEHASVARAVNNLGMFFYRQGRYAEAEARFREAAKVNTAALGPDHWEVGANLNNLGLVLRDTERYEEAETVLRRALEIDLAARPGHQAIPETRNNLAALLVRMGRYQEAETLYRTARVEYARLFSEDDFRVATTESLLGECLMRMGRTDEAEPLLRRAFEVLVDGFPMEHGRVQATVRRLVDLMEMQGNEEEARRYRGMLNP